MLIIGVDENGLGPLLGPLVVTAAVFEADEYDEDRFWSLAGEDLPADDSKAIFNRKTPARGEDAIRRWLELFAVSAASHEELVEKVSSPLPLEIPCPEGGPLPPCSPSATHLPRWCAERSGISLGVWNRFDAARIRPRGVAAHICCPGALNQALAGPEGNKLELDFTLMMSLVSTLGEGHDEVTALCGKIGSTKTYNAWFEKHGFKVTETIEELRERSTYIVEGLGRVSFIRDGDALHLPVAVASMVGKYLRELAVEDLNQVLGRTSKKVSGYRDKVTAGFVEDTAELREEMGLEDRCFKRSS